MTFRVNLTALLTISEKSDTRSDAATCCSHIRTHADEECEALHLGYC